MRRTLPSLSIYLHWPWCQSKCPYCDFNSHSPDSPPPAAEYLDALLTSIALEGERHRGREVGSLFFGGGTPSLMEGAMVAALIGAIDRHFTLAGDCEITLEANPGSSEMARFADYRRAGVNRLSLGIQSLHPQRLQSLGRIHNPAQALEAYAAARRAGFRTVNVDLMYGLPGGSLVDGSLDLERVIALEPDHLSWYQLTIEPNTPFHHQPPALPDDELCWQLEQEGLQRLAAAGYAHYEVSAHARPGAECRHNLNYWHYGDYVAIGAGAHGKRSHWSGERFEVERYRRHSHPRAYLASPCDQLDLRQIGGRERAGEWMLNGLRLTGGVSLEQLEQHAIDYADLAAGVAEGERLGLLEVDGQTLRPTRRGREMLNDLVALFL